MSRKLGKRNEANRLFLSLILVIGIIVLFGYLLSNDDPKPKEETKTRYSERKVNTISSAEYKPEPPKKTPLGLKMDSLDKVYQEKGFEDFAHALAVDKMIYSGASFIVGQNNAGFSDAVAKKESKLADEIFSTWLKQNNIKRKDFEKDRLTDVLELKNTAHISSKKYSDNFKNHLLSVAKTKGSLTKNDILKEIDIYVKTPKQGRQFVPATVKVQKEDIEKWMSDWDGSIFEFEYAVKKMLHDPSSFEHVETSYNGNHGEARVRMKFRATNKLGTKVLNQADAILNTNDGTVSNITIK